jgi:polar amino acid transport system substrate-binding protein
MKTSVLILFFCFLILVSTGFASEISVRVPSGNVYPPFFSHGKDGRWGGLSIELADILLMEARLKPVYTPLPFSRAIEYIKGGQIDMMLNLTPTKERKTFLYFIGPQLDETIVLVVKKESDFSILSLDDIKKLPNPIGIEQYKVYGRVFEQKKKADRAFSNAIEAVTDINLNEKKLQKNRLSGFLGYGYNTYYRIKTDPLYKNFKIHPFIVEQNWVYFGFSKKSVSAQKISRLQNAYEKASKKGLFENVRQQYYYK